MTTNSSVRVAQIGIGYWGPNLLRNLVSNRNCDVKTVVDIAKERRDFVKGLYPSIVISDSTNDIFDDPEIQAVVIATPVATHFELTMKALESGKHVLVEKPLAMTTREAEELVSLAKEKKRILMVGHTFLYNAAVRKVKEYIDSGELGEIYYILAQRLNLGRVRQDVNAMWNLAPHDISIILYWLDEIPSHVSAKGLTFLQDGIDDVVFMDLDFPSGRTAHIHVSWLHPNKTRQMIIVGSKKMLVYDDVSSDAKITIYDKGIEKKRIIRDLPDIESFGQFQVMHRTGDIHIPKVDFKEPLRMECHHFIDCIINGGIPLTDGQDGLRVVNILEKAQHVLDQTRQ